MRKKTIFAILFFVLFLTAISQCLVPRAESQSVLAAPAQSGVVSGQVRTADGSPAGKVRVEVQTVNDVTAPGVAGTVLSVLTETDAAGRFRLEGIRPGRYYISAGLATAPTYFPGVGSLSDARIVTVGSSATLTDINFALALPTFVRIRGNVTRLPPGIPAGLIRIILQSTSQFGSVLYTPVQSDGAFEFSKVPVGEYSIRPSLGGVRGVLALDKDIDNIEIVASTVIVGKVVMDDASSLPIQASSPAVTTADSVPSVRMRVDFPLSSIRWNSTTPLRDGSFAFLWFGPGARIDVGMLPWGYYVKSLSQGPADLLTSTASPSPQVVVILTRIPPAGAPKGVRVTGRITGLDGTVPASSRWVVFQSLAGQEPGRGMPAQRFGEALLRTDGTFEMENVMPGTYNIGVLPATAPSAGPTLVVPNDGLENVEVSFTPPARPPR